MSTLEYHEMILGKVSFSEELLIKELEKSIRSINCNEEQTLLKWCRENLGEKYEKIAVEMMHQKMCSWDEENYKN